MLLVPTRAAPEDVLCGAEGLERLAPGARVGTSSIRRLAQLRAAREDLEVVPVRGNVDTRLRKLGEAEEGLGAIVLARAGLQRLGLEGEVGSVLDPQSFVPAPGQGTLALQGRDDDERARAAVLAITDSDTFACLLAERTLARTLGADCHTPLGAHASPTGDGDMLLRAWVGLPDGSAWAVDERLGDLDAPAELAEEVAERLAAAGARELLARAEEMAGVGSH